MDNKLLDILVCPLCNGKLSYVKNDQRLVCRFDRLSFPFDDDIPVLLAEKATSLTGEEVDKIDE